jgi:hypothetical protein
MSTALTTESAPKDTIPFLVTSRGRIVTSTGGDIASSSCKGFTVTKTSGKVGRYTVQAKDGAGSSCSISRIEDVNVTIFSPTADVAITSGSATDWTIRGYSASSGLFYLQFFTRADTVDTTITVVNADAELEDGAMFTISIVSERNSVSP